MENSRDFDVWSLEVECGGVHPMSRTCIFNEGTDHFSCSSTKREKPIVTASEPFNSYAQHANTERRN